MLNCFSWENMAKNSIRALIFFLLSNPALAEINIPNVSELEMTGRINIDTDYFDGLFREGSNNSIMKGQLRRARFAINADMFNEWSAKLQLAINENKKSLIVKDFYLVYEGWNFADVKMGKFKEPFGLERITSSKNTVFIERSLMSNVFSFGRNTGINFNRNADWYTWNVGLYQVSKSPRLRQDGGLAITQRFTLSPLKIGNGFSHLGLAYSKRELDGAGYELKSNGGVFSGFNMLNTPILESDSLTQWGSEVAFGKDKWSIQAEYQAQEVTGIENSLNIEYRSYYTHVSYFISNDKRRYKNGRFVSVRPSSSSGALELTARYSVIENQSNWQFDELDKLSNKTIGINYYLNRDFKLMLNILELKSSLSEAISDQLSGQALSLRIQVNL